MANTKNTRKPLTTQQKGYILLALLLALTILLSCLGLITRHMGDNDMYEHRGWVPVSSADWPASLPVTRALNGGEAYEFTYTVPEDASETAEADTVNTIRNRLNALGEYDVDVSAAAGTLRVETRKLENSRIRELFGSDSNGYFNVFATGRFSFSDDEGEVLTGKDIKNVRYSVKQSRTSNAYTYTVTFETTDEAKKLLEEKGVTTLSVTRDGQNVISAASVDGGNVVGSVYSSSMTVYNEPSRVSYYLKNGTVDVTLTDSSSSEIGASSRIVLTVVLIAGAALLLGSLVYMYMKGKLTGISGFLSVWVALLISLFLVATIVVPTVYVLNTGCLIAVLLGLLLAVNCAVNRTEAITAQVKDGAAVKQAAKLGFSSVAKNLWITHGIVLAVALVLMLIPFAKSTGYCLACGVVGSAVAMLVMRAFQYAFNMITVKTAQYGGNN